jgi:hypothetical protein
MTRLTNRTAKSTRKRGKALGLPKQDPRPFDPSVIIAAVDATIAREQAALKKRSWLDKLFRKVPVADTAYEVQLRLAEALEGRELTTDRVDRALAPLPAAVEVERKIA